MLEPTTPIHLDLLDYWPLLALVVVVALAIWVGCHAGSAWTGFAAALSVLPAGGALIWWGLSGNNWYSVVCGIGSIIFWVVSVWTSPVFDRPLQQGIADVSADFAGYGTSQMYSNQLPLDDYQRLQRLQNRAPRDCYLAHLDEIGHFAIAAAETIYVDPLIGAFLPSPDTGPHLGLQCARDYVQARTIAPWTFSDIKGSEREALERKASNPE